MIFIGKVVVFEGVNFHYLAGVDKTWAQAHGLPYGPAYGPPFQKGITSSVNEQIK